MTISIGKLTHTILAWIWYAYVGTRLCTVKLASHLIVNTYIRKTNLRSLNTRYYENCHLSIAENKKYFTTCNHQFRILSFHIFFLNLGTNQNEQYHQIEKPTPYWLGQISEFGMGEMYENLWFPPSANCFIWFYWSVHQRVSRILFRRITNCFHQICSLFWSSQNEFLFEKKYMYEQMSKWQIYFHQNSQNRDGTRNSSSLVVPDLFSLLDSPRNRFYNSSAPRVLAKIRRGPRNTEYWKIFSNLSRFFCFPFCFSG